ncbi:MAG: exosortase T [Sphingobacteriales bacterium]|nr:exosortase T [Sphingobacteriales bacterium]
MRYPLPCLFGPTALIVGLILLAAHPLLWLVQTWFDPAYDSQGLWVAALAGSLLLWSATSPLQRVDSHQRLNGISLLALTALLRLLGQWLGINTLGAAALAVDVYAIGLLLGLQYRSRPLAAGWLALLFAFALPIERILQRGFGFVLQQVSAAGACGVLKLGQAPVQCDGLQLQWHEQVVLVDLPCSGTRGLLLLLLLFVTLAALTRPEPRQAVFGALLALAAAALGNSLRIVAPRRGPGASRGPGRPGCVRRTLAQHAGLMHARLIGIAAVAVGTQGSRCNRPVTANVARDEHTPPLFPTVKPWVGLTFLLACAGIVMLPPQPLDVARPQSAPQLPDRIALFAAQPGTLTDQEQAYFTRYGGGAARAAYGPFGLLVVSTSAPLRHLHSPEECLTGNGHTVRYLGQTGGVTPSAVYRSTDPQGQSWRITVSFVSERGEWTPHVAEAIWRWLQAPGTTWRMVQRIAPWELLETQIEHFDAAVWRALDLSPSAQRGAPQPLTVKL